MPVQLNNRPLKGPKGAAGMEDYRLLFFSELLKRPVCAEKVGNRLGKLTDLVFRHADPYPEAVGIYLEHGWGKPTEFIPWDKVIKIDDDAILVNKPQGGDRYPPFVDQPGWLLLNEHLMGRTIVDMDGRTIEVVNDVQLLESKKRLLIIHVDTSFNGFLRKWGLGRLTWLKDNFISWRYVQPLSLEDAGTTDSVALSVTRRQLKELPGEDLADVLEVLSGEEQEAFFSALDAEKAAETLLAAEPRTQRQLVADLRREKARSILAELSVPQLADLLSVLPHDDMKKMLGLLPKPDAERILAIITEHETTARALMSSDFVTATKETTVSQILNQMRTAGWDHDAISYIYVVSGEEKLLVGVVDLREIVLAAGETSLGELMIAPVVSAQDDDTRDTIEDLFIKYHFRMLPVVDAQDHMLGVIRYNDIMTGLQIRVKR
jgi:CBS domain-containing protein/sporulation protein YlmC with PRC-barrel domain